MPFFSNILTVVEVGKLPISTILLLAEVIKNIGTLDSSLFHGNLYKIRTIITLRGGNVKILNIILSSSGDVIEIVENDGWTIIKDDCPQSFISELDNANQKKQCIDGNPAAVVDFPREIRAFILERANV